MDKSIINISLKTAAFFFLLSFILKGIFYNSLFSLLVHPMFIALGWLVFTAGVLFFLKHDFPEIYKLFFPDDNIDDISLKIFNRQNKKKSKKNFEAKTDDHMDYDEIYQKKGISLTSKEEENNRSEINRKTSSRPTEDEAGNIEPDFFNESDPKDLAKVVKKFLNE